MGRFLGGIFGNMIDSDSGGNDGVYSSNDQYYKARRGGWLTEPISATGGNEVLTPGNGYKYHIFTSPGNFAVSALGNTGGTVDYLIVAGGGGGGAQTNFSDASGGGGAGGFRTQTNIPVAVSSITVTIGAGGQGGYGSPYADINKFPFSISAGTATDVGDLSVDRYNSTGHQD